MTLRIQIEEKYKASIKSRNAIAINALRLIKSAIKDKDIKNRTGDKKEEINDQQILNLLQYLIKQRKDSIESFKAASRNDLVEQEQKEIEIINQFLPKQLNIEDIEKIIKKFVEDNNLSSIKDMGKVMNYLKENYAGIVDMSVASRLVKELFSN